MVNMLCKTKGNADPKGKMRVYFTCHPDDFDKYFDTVCNDIFNAVDCAIYYTEDMTSQIPDRNLSTDLGSNNIFVIPVTYKLLSTPNRAMDKDFPYARSEHIPVLPIMMEEGIDSIYSSPEKFGEIQYLNPYSSDFTEISYQEKLKKYLNTLFVSEELAVRVKAAFAAYIFLSYRKKDRIYANELMRIIHSDPDFSDIAIWFDEFLTPGESFKENINNMLSNSKLFAMVVTPNLLEEPDGKPNYVMSEEYPQAKNSGINILPLEMEKTNIDELKQKFSDIPECVNPTDDEELLTNRLHEILADYINFEKNEDMEHAYLIGMAYLFGYDVEVDRARGVELVTKAAEDGLTEAMETLYDMYSNGNFVKLNYSEAIKWAKRLADYYTQEFGPKHRLSLHYRSNLALSYMDNGDYDIALELNKDIYEISRKTFGKEDTNTINSMRTLASNYSMMLEHEKALELKEQVYKLCCKLYGKDDMITMGALNNLASTHGHLNNHKEAMELKDKVYKYMQKTHGDEHVHTLRAQNNIAFSYIKMQEYDKALELNKKVYAALCIELGEEHPNTLTTLSNLATSYEGIGDVEKAKELENKAYMLRCKVLGKEHPDSVKSLSKIAGFSLGDKDTKNSLELNKKAYNLSLKVLGERHFNTLASLNNYAEICNKIGYYHNAMQLREKNYKLCCEVLGEDDPNTMIAARGVIDSYERIIMQSGSLEIKQKSYEMCKKVFGMDSPHTITALNRLAMTYAKKGKYRKALELMEVFHENQVRAIGKNHKSSIETARMIDEIKLRLNM